LKGKDVLSSIAEKVILAIEKTMTEKLAVLFDGLKDMKPAEIIDIVIKTWTIASKMEQWIGKMFVSDFSSLLIEQL
jgi:hypothetical protein